MASDLRYQVFISSTYDDLREERQQATQAILEMAHMPAGMELFPASDLSQWELIKRVIDESDYYIVILGGRYGSVHSTTGTSFTELEYDYATSIGVPVLGFVRRDISILPAKFVEKDPVSAAKLEDFREKVLSRTCRLFDAPLDLGLHVMKSLTSEMRINPRVGWVKANQARSKEDVEREQNLIEEVRDKSAEIDRLEREARDRDLPIADLQPEDLAHGDDPYELTVNYQNRDKALVSESVTLTWDEIFSVIAPNMYGYILRRVAEYNEVVGSFTFEGSLIEYVRSKIIEKCGNRKLNILAHQIDDFLIQFRQLGLIKMEETVDEKGKKFRGFTLTHAGEIHLTKLRARRREQVKKNVVTE